MVLVAQIGARRHYAVPSALEQEGLLTALYTDVCMSSHWLKALGYILPASAPLPGWKNLSGRRVTGVPDSKIQCLWQWPWQFHRFKNEQHFGGQYARFVAQNTAFGKEVVRRGFADARAVYGFNGAAVEIFEAAKKRGLLCILDMTIAPLQIVEQLLTEERKRFPSLEAESSPSDSPAALISREQRECELADLILCGSEYVVETLKQIGIDASKCRVARWGYSGPSVEVDRTQRTGPLRVLIAGTVELRKGVPYVLEAARQLADARFHFRFVGPCRMSGRAIEEQFTDSIKGCHVEFAGPVPRSEMTREYQTADVLLHPSLAEGSANVCYEAMAHGLPVIATPNAGSAVNDGVDGVIIPIRDSNAIANALRQMVIRDTRKRLGDAAKLRSSSLGIIEYQRSLSSSIRGLQ